MAAGSFHFFLAKKNENKLNGAFERISIIVTTFVGLTFILHFFFTLDYSINHLNSIFQVSGLYVLGLNTLFVYFWNIYKLKFRFFSYYMLSFEFNMI